MRALLLTSLLSLVLTAPVAAEIVDLRARVDGGHGQIWIAFDEQPSGLATEVTESGLSLTVTGVEVRGRAISPASDTLVAAVSVDPLEQGGVIHLYGSRAWTGARAELRQGGVLVSMEVGPEQRVRLADAARRDGSPASSGTGLGTARGTDTGFGSDDVAVDAMADPMTSDAGAGPAAGSGVPAQSPEPAMAEAPAAWAPTPLFAQSDASARRNAAVAPPGSCVAEAEAVEQSPWDDELLHAQAACLEAGGHLASAASIYEQMLAFEPENFRATIALAEIRVEQGDSEAARTLYDQAASHAISDSEAARARSRLRALRDQ